MLGIGVKGFVPCGHCSVRLCLCTIWGRAPLGCSAEVGAVVPRDAWAGRPREHAASLWDCPVLLQTPYRGLYQVLVRAGAAQTRTPGLGAAVTGVCILALMSVCLHLLSPVPVRGRGVGCAVGRQDGCQATGAVRPAKRCAGSSTQALPAATRKVTATAGDVTLPKAVLAPACRELALGAATVLAR